MIISSGHIPGWEFALISMLYRKRKEATAMQLTRSGEVCFHLLCPLFQVVRYEVWMLRQNGVYQPLGWLSFHLSDATGSVQIKERQQEKESSEHCWVIWNKRVSETCSSLLHSDWFPIKFLFWFHIFMCYIFSTNIHRYILFSRNILEESWSAKVRFFFLIFFLTFFFFFFWKNFQITLQSNWIY